MAAGTLCISKVAGQPTTYRATFVAYDATPPSAVTVQGTDGLRSFLTDSVQLHDSEREHAVRDATERGLVLLRNVEVVERLVAAA